MLLFMLLKASSLVEQNDKQLENYRLCLNVPVTQTHRVYKPNPNPANKSGQIRQRDPSILQLGGQVTYLL